MRVSPFLSRSAGFATGSIIWIFWVGVENRALNVTVDASKDKYVEVWEKLLIRTPILGSVLNASMTSLFKALWDLSVIPFFKMRV